MPSFSGRTPGIGAIQKEPAGLRKREGGSLREHKHIESVKKRDKKHKGNNNGEVPAIFSRQPFEPI